MEETSDKIWVNKIWYLKIYYWYISNWLPTFKWISDSLWFQYYQNSHSRRASSKSIENRYKIIDYTLDIQQWMKTIQIHNYWGIITFKRDDQIEFQPVSYWESCQTRYRLLIQQGNSSTGFKFKIKIPGNFSLQS